MLRNSQLQRLQALQPAEAGARADLVRESFERLRKGLGLRADVELRVVTGPATDNVTGTRRLNQQGLPAANIFLEADKVCQLAAAGLAPEEEG